MILTQFKKMKILIFDYDDNSSFPSLLFTYIAYPMTKSGIQTYELYILMKFKLMKTRA